MGCLSNVDIENELGRNIYIYPLKLDNIKASTINLTASKFAWSIGKNKLSALGEDRRNIIIPPNDTVIVQTEEVIYVTNKICGDYHSRVRMVSKGIGHIGTTLDPLYIGPSLIALHNHTAKEVKVEVGEKIVSLMLYYLTNQSTKENSNLSGHSEMLNGCEEFEKIDRYLDQGWCKNPQELHKKMRESDEYKKLENAREAERLKKISREKKSLKHYIRYCVAYLLLTLLLGCIIYAISIAERKISGPTSKLPVTNFMILIGCSGVFVPIIGKCYNSIKKLVDRRIENAGIKN